MTTGAGSTYSATGIGMPGFHYSWRRCRDEHVGLEEALRSRKTLHSFRRCLLADRCSAQKLKGLGAVDHLGGDRHCCCWENCWRHCHIGRWSRESKGQCWSHVTCACVTASAGVTYSTTELCHITEKGPLRTWWAAHRKASGPHCVGGDWRLNDVLLDLQTVECRLSFRQPCGFNTTCPTGKSTTITMCCQLTSPQPAPVEPARPAQQGHRPLCGCSATLESTSSSRRLDLRDQPLRHNRDADEFVDEVQLPNLKDLQHNQDHGHLWNLRGHLHSQTMGTCRCKTTAKSPTLSKICTCWIFTGFRTVCPVGTCLNFETGTVAVGKTVVAAFLMVIGDA